MASLLGLIASPLARWAAIGLAAVALYGTIYARGYSARDATCRTAALQAENSQLKARIQAYQDLADADAKRAETDSKADQANRKKVDETPANPAACLDRAAAGRVRSVR
ncbi:MAG: hypothetical protein B7Y12_02100 [Rhizobiales bacterium 24-66-13]|nr:MAG: hypothetical protein B7Y61_01130 [Rhizobiales bacterium 35-66-30]OYZ82807.1 MAG: hypothetical protein B7Y12_02100 [Rhizobiales bacterium 24-66-13]OZB11840.1 MAG: hypothetical protein B7X67_02080 [Rhizobiales bacterium 39-66-18]HQS45936.1 hypothetical protein [Xanthobacteraceae bacterium]